jgi:hypothetical protein
MLPRRLAAKTVNLNKPSEKLQMQVERCEIPLAEDAARGAEGA